jgi:hypothetical protein
MARGLGVALATLLLVLLPASTVATGAQLRVSTVAS